MIDDTKIEEQNLIERYVLGDLTAEEEIELENALAERPELVDQVEAAMGLRDGLRAVAVEDMARTGVLAALATRLRRSSGVLAALFVVALLPAMWLGLENRQLNRQLDTGSTPIAGGPTVVLDVVRGDETVRSVPTGSEWLTLAVEVDDGVETVQGRLLDASGAVVWQHAALEPDPWGVVRVLVPREALSPGEYALALEGAEAGALGPYRFRVPDTP